MLISLSNFIKSQNNLTQSLHSPAQLNNRNEFIVKKIGFNTERRDFGTFYFDEKVVFTSERRTNSLVKHSDVEGNPYFDLYISDVGEKGNLINISKFGNSMMGKYHEGPISINSDGNLLVFTRNNYDSKSTNGKRKLELVSSRLEGNSWTKPEKITFNSTEYSCGHGVISADNKWLYFVSDMPGGFGGTDLYRAVINPDGTFGEPVNLGELINSDQNEMFPFIHQDGILFYASNKDGGLGGLDIYAAQVKNDESFGKIIHPGAPLNSIQDDFALIIDGQQKNGYFSSNREGGAGSDDIFALELLKPFKFGTTINGTTVDQNGTILTNVLVRFQDLENELLDSVMSNEIGEFNITIDYQGSICIFGNKKKYFETISYVDLSNETEIKNQKLILEIDPNISLSASVIEKQSRLPVANVNVKVTDNLTGEVYRFITDSTGSVMKKLLDKRLKDKGSYNFELEKLGYLGKKETYNLVFDNEGVFQVPIELLMLEKIEVGNDLSKVIDIKPIYFDLGKSIINPDASIELDKIVEIMNANPTMVIELRSHTDSRGSSESNMKLSDRRAKASAQYIKDRIVDPTRISGKGFGENKIVNECEDGVNCSEEQHQMNRRTEFIIINM